MWQCDGQTTDWCTDKTVLIIIIIIIIIIIMPIAAVSNIICQLSLIEMFCVVSVWNERSIALQANVLPRVAGMLPQRDTDGMSTAAPIDVEDSSSDDDSWIFLTPSQVTFADPLRTSHYSLHSSHSTFHTSHCTLRTPDFTSTAHLALHTSNFTVHTSHFTLQTALFTPHTSHCTPHTSHSTRNLIWALLTLTQLISSHLISSHMSRKLPWITSQYYD